jgi:hypothetical protein
MVEEWVFLSLQKLGGLDLMRRKIDVESVLQKNCNKRERGILGKERIDGCDRKLY